MRYCKSCILPNTRPNLSIDNTDICNACKAHFEKKNIDWNKREKKLLNVIDNAKNSSSRYDCLIPVSGGKDSTWQVVKCLEYGLNPLTVSWKTPVRTEIGQKNLDNLINLGVDHIDYQINPKVEAKLLLASFSKFGTPGLPQHLAIFNIPISIAVKFAIPLVIWGENAAFEYGGTDEEKTGFVLDDKWKKNFGVTHGTTAEDWVSETLSEKELTAYFGPTDKEINNAGVLAIFLGYYLKWDVENSLKFSLENGFSRNPGGPRVGIYDYADIDCDFISLHHYLKWYKYGFTRSWDNLSLEIRNGRMSRDEAISHLKNIGDETPLDDINKFCDFVGITVPHFHEICEKYRNKDIWFQDDGVWKIQNFLIKDWNWDYENR